MSESRQWRNPEDNSATLLSNLTQSAVKWKEPGSAEPSLPFVIRSGASSLKAQTAAPPAFSVYRPSPAFMNFTYSKSRSKGDLELQSLLNYWDMSPDTEVVEEAPSTGNYESVIVGLTLLILCLLIIAIILIIAMFRVRQLRLIHGTRSPSRHEHSDDEESGSMREVVPTYVIGAPPAYQMQKPVCPEPPPSYEYLMQSTIVDSRPEEPRSEMLEIGTLRVRTDEQSANCPIPYDGQVHIQTVSATVP